MCVVVDGIFFLDGRRKEVIKYSRRIMDINKKSSCYFLNDIIFDILFFWYIIWFFYFEKKDFFC